MGGSVTYSYTSNGELTRKIAGSDTTRYSYDVLGNLVKVILPSHDSIEYLIDGQNRRVGRKFNGAVTNRWLYQNQLNPVAELDSAGNLVSRFVYGSRLNVPDYMIKSGSVYRLVTDHLGSVRLVVDTATGAVAQWAKYDEWGVVTADSGAGFQPFGFAGGLVEGSTKLVRFGARDYDPVVGRWAAKDPIGFIGGQASLYTYAANDPANSIDPTGLEVRGRCDVARALKKVMDKMHNPLNFVRRGLRGFEFDYPWDIDFKYLDIATDHTYDDTYVVEGFNRPLRSDEFGNFAAGYAGVAVYGELGYRLVIAGGRSMAAESTSGEARDDSESRPMIDLGASFGDRDYPAFGRDWRAPMNQPKRLTDLCGCDP